MTPDEIAHRYRPLGRLSDLPGERTWLGRIATEEQFFGRGAEIAALLREQMQRSPSTAADLRALAPALFELVLEAFPARGNQLRRRVVRDA